MSRLFHRKSFTSIMQEGAEEGEHTLQRAIGARQLITLGVGAIVGVGGLILTGVISSRYAGPAVLVSIAISSLVALLVSLCYAEFAAMTPVAGSAYTYAYTTLGELPAWIIAWDLLLEYMCGAAMVAWGWSGYLSSLLRDVGINLSPVLSGCRWDTFVLFQGHWEELNHALPLLHAAGVQASSLPQRHGFFDLPGFLVVALFTVVLAIGVKESAKFNGVLVFVKTFIILFFIGAGLFFLRRHGVTAQTNLHPFIPTSIHFGEFGWSGIGRAAAIFIFSFLGTDAVASSAQEAKNPRRDVPIGIVVSLILSTALLLLFAFVLLSAVNYKSLNVADPLAVGMDAIGLHWGSVLITFGALGALSSTILVLLLGASRLLFAVSKDGLLPGTFARIHPKFRTPVVSSVLIGCIVSLLAGFLPIDTLATLFSIGTLFAFLMVCIGLVFDRHARPEAPRPFKVPGLYAVSLVAGCCLIGLIACLPEITWLRFAVWLVVGLAIYFSYGKKHSKVQRGISFEDDSPLIEDIRTTPEMTLLSNVIKGSLKLFVGVFATVAVLAGLSMMLPIVDRAFPASASTLAVLTILAGLAYAFIPGLRLLWATNSSEHEDVDERTIRELIQAIGKGSDGT